jgi:hypothetical protein
MVAPYVLHNLYWLSVASLVFALLAALCWYLARRWRVVHVVA